MKTISLFILLSVVLALALAIAVGYSLNWDGVLGQGTTLVEVCETQTDWRMIQVINEGISENKKEITYQQSNYNFLNCDVSKEKKDYIVENDGSLWDLKWGELSDDVCANSLVQIQQNRRDIGISMELIEEYTDQEVCRAVEVKVRNMKEVRK